jgi:hypothetical protein
METDLPVVVSEATLFNACPGVGGADQLLSTTFSVYFRYLGWDMELSFVALHAVW